MNSAYPANSLTNGITKPALLLSAAILLAYALILKSGSFQFDDYNVIVFNPQIHSLTAWYHELGHGIRPLLKLSYTLDWLRSEGQPFPFHCTNLAIHAGNGLLVFLLSRHYARRYARQHPAWQNQTENIALFTALLFVLHPIQTEAVSYVCGRSSSLMALFYLLALLIHATFSPHLTTRSNPWPGLLTATCFLLALAVKETAITLPFALLLHDQLHGLRLSQALRRQWPNALLLVLVSLYFLNQPDYAAHLERSAHFNTYRGNLANASLGTLWLLRQWFAPLWLNIDPDLPVRHYLDMTSGLALAALCTLTAIALHLRHSRPWWLFAIAWLLLHLLPLYIILPRLDIANERQMLLAGWPLALCLVSEITRSLPATIARRTLAMLLLSCLLLTMVRNTDYRSEITLWQATAQVSPNKSRVHNNLGYAHAQAGQTQAARAAYQRALALEPGNLQARNNLRQLEDARNALPETP